MTFFRAAILMLCWGCAAAPGQTSDPIARNFDPQQVLSALRSSYPGILSDAILAGGDWFFRVRNKPFSWANGRLLPRDQASQWSSFAPQPFYNYTASPPPVENWTIEQEKNVEAQLTERKATNVLRNGAFFDAVWGIHDRGTADDRQKKMYLFGLKVTMHEDLEASLKRIEAALQAQAKTDAELSKFLKGLQRLEGYNWRNIAGTQSRSNHAYGTAIDLIPRSYGGNAFYWLWAIGEGSHWYKWTWMHRWIPPESVIRAFEAEGWVWGGKWILFDTIHFEYRPEILALNGLR